MKDHIEKERPSGFECGDRNYRDMIYGDFHEYKDRAYEDLKGSTHWDEERALKLITQAEAIPAAIEEADTCACGRLLLKDYIEEHL